MERLNSTLQENILVLLAYDDVNGKVVHNMVDPALFEGDYRLVAERCMKHWQQYKEAPKAHTPDLLADILDDPHNRRARTFKRILQSMYELSESVNSSYVMDQLRTFTRMQKLKDAILKSAEQLNSEQEMAIEEIETIWNGLLRAQDTTFNSGMRLTDIPRVVDYIENRNLEFQTGIEQLDKRYIVPSRGQSMLMLAPTGRGKTWFLIQLGKLALMTRKKVAHITLEMSEEQVAQRYYQSLFSVTKRDTEVDVATLEFNALDRLSNIGSETVHPDFTLSSPMLTDELQYRVNWRGERFKNLVIKQFSSMSIKALEGWLDNLEATEGFIPDIILLDYIGLVHTGNSKDPRLALGQAYKDWRGLLIRRHCAGVTAQQMSKEGAKARKGGATHVAEDWSLIATSDIVVSYSSTAEEFRRGLGRMYVDKARDEEDQFGLLLTQNYKMGQFVLESAFLGKEYWKLLDELPRERDSDDDEDEDEDD